MDVGLLERTLTDRGEPSYRSRQVWEWAARGAGGYGEMSNLPAALRTELEREVPFSTLELQREARSVDGTVKALFATADGRPIEAVLMRYRDGRNSVCVSSQSGCPLTCTFCATGSMRFGRNLSAAEIVDQVLHFRRSGAVDHCVFMGMGEPMMNLDNVLSACRRLPDIGITHRRTAISTVGWIPGIERLAGIDTAGEAGLARSAGIEKAGEAGPARSAEGAPPVRLALSLHAPNDPLRSELMPVNDRYPLRDVLAACRAYHRKRRRMVFVEYVMLKGVNDSPELAAELAGVLDPRAFKVNLIPYNPTPAPDGTAGFEGSGRAAIHAFKRGLERGGLRATVRLTRGRDIDAACGQLAAKG